jgi:hypothetical protein
LSFRVAPNLGFKSLAGLVWGSFSRNEFRGNNIGRADGTGKPPAIVSLVFPGMNSGATIWVVPMALANRRQLLT